MDAQAAAPLAGPRSATSENRPFRLRPGAAPAELDAAARRLARPAVRPRPRWRGAASALRGFLAWRIAEADREGRSRIQALADAAVRDLDPLRAPPTPEETARRQPQSLTPGQQAMLARWGYPYVFDTYTFHITLTGKLEGEALAQARAGIAAFADPLPGSP